MRNQPVLPLGNRGHAAVTFRTFVGDTAVKVRHVLHAPTISRRVLRLKTAA